MNNNEMKQYVVAAAAKDNKAMEILYKELYTDVVYICRSFNLGEEDAMDVAQETFIKAFSQLNKLEDKGKFKQWVFRIANNKCLDLLRHNKVIQFDSIENEETEYELPDKGKSVDEIVIEKETSQMLMSVIEMLPIEQRTTVFLFYYQDYSVKEIAQLYGCSENTVRSRLNYAKKFMLKEIEKLDSDKKSRCLVLLPFLYAVFAGERQAFACEIPNCLSVVSAVMTGSEGQVAVSVKLTDMDAANVNIAGMKNMTTSDNVAKVATKVTTKEAAMAGKSVIIKLIIGIVCAAVVVAVVVGTGVLGDSGKEAKKDKTQKEESANKEDTKDDGVHNGDDESNGDTSEVANVIASVRQKTAEITKMTVVGHIGHSDLDARFIDVQNGIFEDVGTWYGYGKNGVTDANGKSYMYYPDAGNGVDVAGAYGKKELQTSISSYADVINATLDEIEAAGAGIKENKQGETVVFADLDMRKLDVIFEYLGEVENVADFQGKTTVEIVLYEDYSIMAINVLNEDVLNGYKETYSDDQLDAVISQVGAGAKLEFAYDLEGVEAPYVSDEFEQLAVPGTISALYRDYPAQYTINLGFSWDFITYIFPELNSEVMEIDAQKNGFEVKVFFIEETDYEDRKIYTKEELETMINGASHSMSAVFSEYKNEDIELTWTTINGLEVCYDNSPSCSVGVSAMGTLAVVKCGVGDEERALCVLIEDRGADIFAQVDASKEAREAILEEIVSAITVKKIEKPRADRENVKEIAESV